MIRNTGVCQSCSVSERSLSQGSHHAKRQRGSSNNWVPWQAYDATFLETSIQISSFGACQFIHVLVIAASWLVGSAGILPRELRNPEAPSMGFLSPELLGHRRVCYKRTVVISTPQKLGSCLKRTWSYFLGWGCQSPLVGQYKHPTWTHTPSNSMSFFMVSFPHDFPLFNP